MDVCCQSNAEDLERLKSDHKKALQMVLAVNATLFVVELTTGLMAHSTSLLADSLDMLGDSLVYGFSLYVLWRSSEWKAVAAIFKGVVMAGFGIGVLGEAIYKVIVGVVPSAETMGIIGMLVLLGNGICFLLLFRHQSDDINMRSTWLCSRNDIIANVAVLFAAAGVALARSNWPDVFVGGVIAFLFLRTSLGVLTDSIREYRELGLPARIQ